MKNKHTYLSVLSFFEEFFREEYGLNRGILGPDRNCFDHSRDCFLKTNILIDFLNVLRGYR